MTPQGRASQDQGRGREAPQSAANLHQLAAVFHRGLHVVIVQIADRQADEIGRETTQGSSNRLHRVSLEHEVQKAHPMPGLGARLGHHAGAVRKDRRRIAVPVGGDDQDIQADFRHGQGFMAPLRTILLQMIIT